VTGPVGEWRLVFVDCETTGLDPELHDIWEVSAWEAWPEAGGGYSLDAYGPRTWQLPVPEAKAAQADPRALDIGGYWQRRWRPSDSPASGSPSALLPELGYLDGYDGQVVHPARMRAWCEVFTRLTWGALLVGVVVSFDADRLGRLLRSHGIPPGWHYHLLDVETFAAGRLQQRPPWRSRELSERFGVDPAGYAEHTASGDVRWSADLFMAVLGLDS